MKKIDFRKFLLFKLPLAYIAGIRLKEYTDEKAVIRVNYNWWTQNPFKSMFWAVQGMAAELATGTLCLNKIRNSNKKISMLLIGMEAEFTKKAKGEIRFICEQGKEVDQLLHILEAPGQSASIELISTGYNKNDEKVAFFRFKWSFMVKE